ncbi:MAG: class I SAM-dependent methyltransferase [Rhodospirillaceae bacterium]
MTADLLRAQYEAYPYPARRPADEDQRLITGSPSHLDQLNHYVFGGRLDFAAPLRLLVAGGGTGDAVIMLGQQLKDAGVPARITYLDLSAASREIAEARAARRGLTCIAFHTGSLFDLAGGHGPFDYIDCCGVLHHLADPAAGLSALAAVLAPGGGIGLMVYAPYGRAGVYPMQDALATLTRGLGPAERVEAARRVLRALPERNGLRNNPLLGDHLTSDAGLYDLLLHSCDRAYTVTELAALVAGCGLAITALIEPAQYQPASYVKDARTLRRLAGLPWLEQAAWAEQVGGALGKHVAYLVRPGDAGAAVARLDGLEAVPVLRDIDGPGLARGLRPGAILDADFPGLKLALPLPRLAGPILARVDGRTSLATIFEAVRALDRGLSREVFETQARQLFGALNGIGKMYLRVGGASGDR